MRAFADFDCKYVSSLVIGARHPLWRVVLAVDVISVHNHLFCLVVEQVWRRLLLSRSGVFLYLTSGVDDAHRQEQKHVYFTF